MVNGPPARLRALGIAALAALALLAWGHQLTPRRMYAANGAYRAQVDAFLDGRLALSHAPEALQHDLAWTGSGAQQVWGLGVPLWMTPFEVIGRAIHVTPFPDRLALLAWLALMGCALARAWWRRGGEPWWIGAGSIAICALLPAFVTMVRGRLGVYEEAAAYSYGAAMMLLAGTQRLADAPSRARYLVLVAAAGLGGLIRPTVWFWGLATALVATAMWLRARGRRGLVEVALGAALFVAGGGVLYATNAARFGSGMEFGHRLNLESLPGNLMATRFSYPYQRVGALDATRELVGSLFDRPERRAHRGFYEAHLHRGVSAVPRWREYYFTTFSWWYVPVLLAGLVLGVWAWRRGGPRGSPERWLVPWAVIGGGPLAVFYLHTPSVASRYQLDLAPAFVALLVVAWRAVAPRGKAALAALAAAWLACIATAKLAPPSVRATPIGRAAAARSRDAISRARAYPRTLPAAYALADPMLPAYTDVVPAFVRCTDAAGATLAAAAPPAIGATCVHGERTGQQWRLWGTRTGAPPDACVPPPLPACTRAPDVDDLWCTAGATAATVGTAFAIGTPPPALYLNVFGWDLATGQVPPATYAWISDPAFVELDVATIDGAPAPADWARAVRVAVGPVHLRLARVTPVPGAMRLRFEANDLPRGLTVAFFAFGDDRDLAQPRSRFVVRRIRWR